MNKRHVIWLISKIHNASAGFLESELKSQGINDLVASQGAILGALFRFNGKLKMKDIANLINKDKSTVTHYVDKLSKAGYVIREKSLEDARETFIVITQKAWDIQDKFNTISQNLIVTAYHDFSEEEQAQLIQLLDKMKNNFV